MAGSRPLLRLFAMALALSTASAAQTPDAGYDQPYRPQLHFSPQRNWTNDPNGLVFFHGEYHLFYQYNPFGDEWGHMSWGHAVSKDLLHWQQLPVALAEQGDTMIFTGSVVVDLDNTSGFCAAGAPCMVAVYTGHTQLGKVNGEDRVVQTQNLAWSRDDGRTWTKYEHNPVLDLHMADFRDPSVFWDEHAGHWVMSVALPKEHKVRLYRSPDLKQWTQMSEFGPMGDVAGDWECPDLLHIPDEGGKGAGGTWALKVGLNPGALQGGSGEQYFLGNFDGTRFTAATGAGAQGWTNYGKDDYCAISFNGLPKAEKPVLIGWMNNWQYAAKLPTSPWRGQMSLPRRLSLLHDAAGQALKQEPVVAPLRVKRTPLTLAAGQPFPTGLTGPFELQVRFPARPDHTVGVRLRVDAEHYTDVGFDPARGTVFIDRTHSGLAVAPEFPGRVDAPLAAGRPLDLHLIVDRASVEAFAQDGTLALTDLIFPPAGATHLELFSVGGAPPSVTGELWTLRSIW